MKFVRLAELFAYIVGSIGGFGYALYNNAVFIAVCVVVLAAMAFPEARQALNKLIS